MRFADILTVAASQGGGKQDDPAAAWATAVVANGGTVSGPRAAAMATLIADLKAAGTWALTDDYWLLAAENEASALTSLKQRRLATAVAAPTFTADRQYAFNGTTQYLNTGFIPASHGGAMTGNNLRIASYERTNTNLAGYVAGAYTGSTSNMRLRPRNNGNVDGSLNSGLGAAPNLNSQAMVTLSRTPAGVFEGWVRGVSVGTASPGMSTNQSTHGLFIGCFNNAGSATGFRAASVSLVTVGASFSSAQEAADYAIWQAYLTAIGAQV